MEKSANMKSMGKGMATFASLVLATAGAAWAQASAPADIEAVRAQKARPAACVRPQDVGIVIPSGSRGFDRSGNVIVTGPTADALRTWRGVARDTAVIFVAPAPYDRATLIFISSQNCVVAVDHTTLADVIQTIFSYGAVAAGQGGDAPYTARPQGFPQRRRE